MIRRRATGHTYGMTIKTHTAILIGLALSLSIVACGGAQVIDTWPIGELTYDCLRGSCEDMIDVATAGLDVRNPGHADVTKVEIHKLGQQVDAQGRTILTVMSGGPPRVALFELADGSRRAIGVGYPGVSQTLVVFDNWGAPR